MNEQESTLEEELISAGATAAEAENLARLARRLPATRQLPLMQAPASLLEGKRIARRRGLVRISSRVAMLVGSMATAAIVAAVVVVAAQGAMPGDALYSTKRASEAVALRIDPGFHDQMMMRRADEINQLVASGSNNNLIAATLASYDQSVTHDPAASYAARDYCAGMLEHAAAHANPAMRSQILQSVAMLKLQDS